MDPHHTIHSEAGLRMLAEARRICRELPETEETVDGFGHTTMKVGGKSFVMLGESEGMGGPSLSFKSDRETQEFLIGQEGSRYFRTPYIGHHGWVSVKEPQSADWGELAELLREAYLRAAPKRLAKQLMAN